MPSVILSPHYFTKGTIHRVESGGGGGGEDDVTVRPSVDSPQAVGGTHSSPLHAKVLFTMEFTMFRIPYPVSSLVHHKTV